MTRKYVARLNVKLQTGVTIVSSHTAMGLKGRGGKVGQIQGEFQSEGKRNAICAGRG